MSPIESLLHAATDTDAAAISGHHGAIDNPRRPGNIIRRLLDASGLRAARVVSKSFKAWVEEDVAASQAEAFNSLHTNGHYGSDDDQQRSLKALANISPFCSHLVIHLKDVAAPPPSPFHPPFSCSGRSHSVWMPIFALLGGISTLTISAPGSSNWHVFGNIEAKLESIRVALETKLPRGLGTINLLPINATGLAHFRWRGAAFLEAGWMAESFWSRLTELNIDLLNPLPHLHRPNRKDFVKTLHDFVGSFRRSLRVFCFSWIGAAGPNPLLLDLRYGGQNFSSPAIAWAVLREVVLGNVWVDDMHEAALQLRAPGLYRYGMVEEPMEYEEQHETVWDEESEGETCAVARTPSSSSSSSSPLLFLMEME